MSAVLDQNPSQKHTIKRWAHDQKNPYVQIHNELPRNEKIPPEARLLLIYLLTNKDGWEIRVSQLINHFKPFWGRDKVYKIINQCIEHGYMQRDVLREDGRHVGVNYYVAEYPAFKEFIPLPENPNAVEPDRVNTYYKKEQKSKKEQDIKTTTPLPPKKEAMEPDKRPCVVVVSESPKDKPKKAEVSKDDVHFYCLRAKKDWTPDEIDSAWEAYKDSTSSVSDVYAYVSGIIDKKRILAQNRRNKDRSTRGKPCYKNSLPTLKKESPNTNSTCTVVGFSEQDLDELLGPDRPCKRLSRT